MSKQSAHPSLDEKEQFVAVIGGIGLFFAITAGILAGFGTQDTGHLTVLAAIGLAAVAGSIALWLAMLRPWENFDDLKTPYFTGHDHPDHDEAAHH